MITITDVNNSLVEAIKNNPDYSIALYKGDFIYQPLDEDYPEILNFYGTYVDVQKFIGFSNRLMSSPIDTLKGISSVKDISFDIELPIKVWVNKQWKYVYKIQIVPELKRIVLIY